MPADQHASALPAIACAAGDNSKPVSKTRQLGSRNSPGRCALSRRLDGNLARLGLIAGRLRAGSETGLSDIGFTAAVRAAGFPGPGSGIGLLGSGSSFVGALSCPNGLGDR